MTTLKCSRLETNMNKRRKVSEHASKSADEILSLLTPNDTVIKAEEPIAEVKQLLPLSEDEMKNLADWMISEEWYLMKIAQLPNLSSFRLPKEDLHMEMRAKIISLFSIKTTVNSKKMYFYYEPENIWKPQTKELLQMLCLRMVPNVTSYTMQEIRKILAVQTYIDDSKIDPSHLLPLKNGVFNLQSWEFETHRANHYITKTMNVEFNPKIKTAPKIRNFLKSLTDKEGFTNLVEFWAYSLYDKYPLAKALMMVGEGSNGKTMFTQLLIEFFGTVNCSSLKLQQLEEKFLVFKIQNKMVNIAPDIGSQDLEDTSTFKALTGGDWITCEEKYGQPFAFRNRAKLIFGANKIPASFRDLTHAFVRRWQFVSFPFEFTANPKKSHQKQLIPPSMLMEKITQPNELSGIFNLLLIALARLLKQKSFTYDTNPSYVKEQFVKDSREMNTLLDDRILHEKGTMLKKTQLYSAYCQGLEKDQVLSFYAFNQLVKRTFPTVKDRRVKENGKNVWYWEDMTILYDSKEES